MNILVVTSCTGEKNCKPENQLTHDDFKNIGTPKFKSREKELSAYAKTAVEMYRGQQHIKLVNGLDLLRKSCRKTSIDLKIISAGYGLLDEGQLIVPYEMTFNGMKVKELREWTDRLEIPRNVLKILPEYDLVIFLLGKEYIRAVDFPKKIQAPGTCLFFTGKSSSPYLPSGRNIKTFFLGNQQARNFGAGFVALKGRIIEAMGEAVAAEETDCADDFLSSADNIVDFVNSYRKRKTTGKKTKRDKDDILRADYDSRVIKLPDTWLNRSHRRKLRYFIPEWDDLVNPEYDFENDLHPPGTGDGYEFAQYAHQLYDSPNYDGILVSKIIIEGKKNKHALLQKLGVHRYLRVPRTFPIMGDCGAFGYIMEEVPPYETPEILDYYQRFDFDYGVSIDHLIVNGVLKRNLFYLVANEGSKKEISEEEYKDLKKQEKFEEITSLRRQLSFFEKGPFLYKCEIIDENERARRYELTIDNARDFLEGHKNGNFTFRPVGAVQGWSPESYADAVKEYQKMGYDYIALGGLVRTHTKGILEVLEKVSKVLKAGVDLHLFGVARPNALKEMQALGLTSIDSASFLRRAWLGASANYFTPEQNYAAIRIPQADKSPRAKKMVREGKISLEEVVKLEDRCLKLIRAYDKGQADIEDVFQAVMTYDGLMGGDRNGHEKLIRKTLEDRPWKKCDCKICREVGVEVIVFRGNNRNRRRGFHNTKIFYDQLCRMFEDE